MRSSQRIESKLHRWMKSAPSSEQKLPPQRRTEVGIEKSLLTLDKHMLKTRASEAFTL
jgi:hypothetical protein